MKIQSLFVNGCYQHTINYGNKQNDTEYFIIEYPDNEDIVLFSFSAINNTYIVETDEGQKKYSINTDGIKIDAPESQDGIKKFTISIPWVEFLENTSTPKKTSKGEQKGTPNTEPICEINEGELYENTCTIDGKDYKTIMLRTPNRNNSPLEIRVNFILDGVTKSVVIYVAQSKNIYDVMLDFGSEATQMAITPRSDAVSIDSFKHIFESIKEKYKSNEETEDSIEYYQYEPGDDKLFRTYSLVKKQIAEEEIKTLTDYIALNINGNVKDSDTSAPVHKILFTKQFNNEKGDEYIVVPNVKFSGFGGVELPTVRVGNTPRSINEIGGGGSYFLYRRGMALFLKEALDIIINDQPCNESKPCFVSFHILMPNVYQHSEILTILSLLQTDIEEIINKEEGFSKVIKGFEVTVVSESDASIMGALEFKCVSLRQRVNAGNYLLLDAGKGTLDFSLVNLRYENNGKRIYKNVWRTGIIGAGNSLTYAYLLDLLYEYLGGEDEKVNDTKLRNVLYEYFIDPGDKYLLLNLMRAVENYKKCETTEESITSRQNPSDEIDLSRFAAWIEGKDPEGNGCINKEGKARKLQHKNYVKAMITLLVDEVVAEIDRMQKGMKADNRNRIDGVIYAGRAFLLADFKEQLHEKIQEEYGVARGNANENSLDEIEFINERYAVTMKNVCLLSSSVILRGRYSRKLVSTPILCTLTNDEQNNTGEQPQNQSQNQPEQTTNPGDTPSKVKQWLKNKLENLKNIMSDSSLGEFQKGEEARGWEVGIVAKAVTLSPPLTGTRIDINDPQNEYISIGGRMYLLEGVGSGSYDVFFDGKNYLLRDQYGQKTQVLRSGAFDLRKSQFLQSSLFPNINVTEANIFIPQVVQDTLPVNNKGTDNTTGSDSGNTNSGTNENGGKSIEELVNFKR